MALDLLTLLGFVLIMPGGMLAAFALDALERKYRSWRTYKANFSTKVKNKS